MEVVDLYVGTHFNQSAYENIERRAQRDYKILNTFREERKIQGDKTTANRREGVFQTLREWNRKIRAAVKHLIVRRGEPFDENPRNQSASGMQRRNTQLSGDESITTVDFTQLYTSETDEHLKDKSVLQTESIVDLEIDQGDSDPVLCSETYEDSPYRYRHMLPEEEPKPHVRAGLVKNLSKTIAPLFGATTAEDASTNHSAIERHSNLEREEKPYRFDCSCKLPRTVRDLIEIFEGLNQVPQVFED